METPSVMTPQTLAVRDASNQLAHTYDTDFTESHIGRLQREALWRYFDRLFQPGERLLDLGWHLGEKRHWRKFALWEEATRTPVIWRVPKGIAPGLEQGTEPGSRVDTPVTLLEIYPTLIELAGLEEKPEISGVSDVPLLADSKATWDRPALTTYGRMNHALRSPRWRYIRYRDGEEELYDHTVDPMEWHNLKDAPQYRDVMESLARQLPQTNAEDVPSQQ